MAGDRTRNGLFRFGREMAIKTQAAWDELSGVIATTPGKVWIWSDLHLDHTHINRLAGRPFTSVDEMNTALLDAALAVVGPEDWLLFCGDLSFGTEEDTVTWLRLCPGRKATLLGNHDLDKQKTHWKKVWACFEAVGADLSVDLTPSVDTPRWGELKTLWFTHYPLWDTWVPEGTLNVHGHTHGQTLPGRRMNVSVEQTGYGPVRLDEMMERG